MSAARRCILLKFYIKPQPCNDLSFVFRCCILLKFYIKPQLHRRAERPCGGCILLKFYIKPQLRNHLYRKFASCILLKFYIKPQLSTLPALSRYLLYLIEILHQTTTIPSLKKLYWGCILLKFYIKPQRRRFVCRPQGVVSYWNSTSNHNIGENLGRKSKVVSYWNSTSNHNSWIGRRRFLLLYLIEILHQTTTAVASTVTELPLYLIEILHQTTTNSWGIRPWW